MRNHPRSSRARRVVAALAGGCLVVAACGGEDPVSTGIPSGGAGGARPIATDGAASVPSTAASSTAVPTTAVPPTTTTVPAASTSAPPAPTTIPPTTLAPVTSTSEDEPADGAADEPALELLAQGDEPTFDVLPLQSLAFGNVDDAGIAGPPATDGTGVAPTGWAAFDAHLADALIRNGNTAAAVAVSIGGEVVHTAAFGERTSGDPAEAADRFRIASISKVITAITVLRLVEDGVVGLDEPIGQRIADHLGVSASSGARALTVRRLLTHTTGFGKYYGTFFGGSVTDCDAAARVGIRQAAGAGGYVYSNMNYCIAGVLIEALTGRSYDEVAYEQVLTPLGLSGMRLAATFDPGPEEIAHPSTPGRNYMEALGASGGWIAAPADLVRIIDSLDPSTPGYKPIGEPLLTAMMTPVGGQLGQRGYGMGVIVYGPGRYGHTGTIESTHAMTQNRGDGVTWALTVSGPYPDDTPRLESIINSAFLAGGFIAG